LRSHEKPALDLVRLGEVPLLSLKKRGFGRDRPQRRQVLLVQPAGQDRQEVHVPARGMVVVLGGGKGHLRL
jgi:hypothetical protein